MRTARGLAAAIALLAGAGGARAACDASTPSGLFKGTVTSAQAGRLEVTLNLRCAEGRYDGLLVTPVGKFALSAGEVSGARLRLTFGQGAGSVSADLVSTPGNLAGSFQAGDDRGPMSLQRTGEPSQGDPTALRFDLTPAEWRQDLAFLALELTRRHGSAFHRTSKRAFDAAVARLSARIGGLDPDQVYVEFDRIATMVGDGHTFVMVPPDAAQMPLLLRVFDGQYRVVSVNAGHERALGARVTGVNGVPIAKVKALALGPTPGDETQALREDRTAYFLTLGLMLHGLGLTPTREAATYDLQPGRGPAFSEPMRALGLADAPQWKPVTRKVPFYRQHGDAAFWCASLESDSALYCNFNGYADLANRSKQLFQAIGEHHPKKVIVDLRLNTGGDFNDGLKYVIDPLAGDKSINAPGRLYVLIGRGVFSAGMSNAAQFRSRTHATLVGEPIGERPNSWQEAREFTLPNSHMVVRYSTQFYRFVERGENLIRPDVTVAPTWDQYAQGVDPVLDWVLTQGPK